MGASTGATCTCPYNFGGYCKHIVAVLLTVLQGEEITVKPELDTLLAGLTEAQLRRIIRAVAEDQPAFAAAIEQEVEWLKTIPVAEAASTAPAAHAIAFDLAAIRREIGKDIRQAGATGGGSGYSERYWDDEEAGLIYPDAVLGPHRQLAERLLAAGDAAAATDVITAMIEAWGGGIAGLDEWVAEVNQDAFQDAASDLGVLLAEALLSQDFSPDQRAQWLARVEDWGEDLINLDVVETALDQWWDYPPLVAAMQGSITEQGAWGEGEAPDFADELTLVRLRILERQGRTQEYIHLAEAEGQTSLYVNMLARSGQVAQAVAEARQWTESPTAILSLARVLVEQGERAAALDVAGHGLDMTGEGSKTELARWTVTLAQGADDPALALRAAQTAFTSSFELADYQVAERLAGADWPAIKAGLLEQMARSDFLPQSRHLPLRTHAGRSDGRSRSLVPQQRPGARDPGDARRVSRLGHRQVQAAGGRHHERRQGQVLRFGRRLGAHRPRHLSPARPRGRVAGVSERPARDCTRASISWCRCCGRYGRRLNGARPGKDLSFSE